MPYIYLIYSKTLKMYYVGVRYAKNCNPNDLWVKYFTSSKTIHKLIELYGKEDFKYKIVKIFKTAEEAILQEHQYTLKAIKKEKYLNIKAGIAVRNNICSFAGKISGAIQKEKKLGIHGLSEEQKRINSSKAGKKGCLKNGWKDPIRQAERGRRGGPKNKGFKWYHDGTESYKYTPKQQKELPFEVFLKYNPEFSIGRIPYWLNNENRYKLGSFRRGKPAWNKGIPFSEESKRKMSASHIKTNQEKRKRLDENKKN